MTKLLARGFGSFAKFSQLALPAEYSERRALKTPGPHFRAFDKPSDYMSVSEYRQRYDPLASDFPSSKSTLTGRVERIRSAGEALHFVDLVQEGRKIQLVVNQRHLDQPVSEVIGPLQRGDIVQASGLPCRSKSGELSCRVQRLEVLTPCLVNLPDSKTGLSDPELRAAKRHLDLLANQESRAVFKTRAQIISCIRRFLDERDFTEVETPILAKQVGGAVARPFRTTKALANGAQEPLVLRIAPELYLKRLLVGGFDRVYELGRQFRNEGVDSTHNPEFTSCEFYAAYTSVGEIQKMTEELLRQLADLTGRLDEFSDFRCIDVVQELRHSHAVDIDASNPETLLREPVLKRIGFTKASSPSPAKVFDKLVAKYIEPLCHDRPTFLYRPPLFTSPLARADSADPSLAARFELFYRGHELVNAYQELTDPFEQRCRFLAQQAAKTAAASEEALEIPDGDEDFVNALECAMPPATGCGIGIDRLVMILCGRNHIRDVILFPY